MLARINKWHARIDAVMAFISAGLVLAMTVAGTLDVTGRYLLNTPIPGTYEGMRFALGAVAFFAFPYVQYKRRHITVEMVHERLSAKTLLVLDIIFLILILGTVGTIAWQGGKAAMEAWRFGDYTIGVVELPTGPAKMVVPIGCGLLSLRILSQICVSIAELYRGTKIKGGA